LTVNLFNRKCSNHLIGQSDRTREPFIQFSVCKQLTEHINLRFNLYKVALVRLRVCHCKLDLHSCPFVNVLPHLWNVSVQ